MINLISNLFIPVIVLVVVFYGMIKKVNVYDAFLEGSKEGINLGLSILPYLITMIFGIDILINSKFLLNFFGLFKNIFNLIHVPIEIIPMIITRPISGNASFLVMTDIIKNYGVDSYLGCLASVMQGSTDTTIYVLSIYFGSIGIKNIKYALKAGLLADLVAIIMSIIVVTLFFL